MYLRAAYGPLVLIVLGLCGYLAACAGAQRWLTLREWWGKTPAVRTDRDDKPDCDGGIPCSTCQDKRECGRGGCVRQKEQWGN
jgi:hypothetical protein